MDRSPGAWLAFVGVERNTLNRDAGALEVSVTRAVISVDFGGQFYQLEPAICET